MHLIPATPANIERPAVVAVASGKGGVGKSHASVNLAVALARLGKRVTLLDADMGLANAGMLLGLKPDRGVERVLEGEAIAEVARAGPAGVRLLSASALIGDEARARLCAAFAPMVPDLDYLLIDAAAGIGADVTGLASASDVVAILLADEPASFMDAYALLKTLHLDHGCRRFVVVTSMVPDEAAGRLLFANFGRVVSRFLDAEVAHLGSVPRDGRVRQAALAKRPVVELFPDSRAGLAFVRLARALDADVARHPVDGASTFFGKGAAHACAA